MKKDEKREKQMKQMAKDGKTPKKQIYHENTHQNQRKTHQIQVRFFEQKTTKSDVTFFVALHPKT